MGTRSLTFVYNDDEPVMCMYRQFDGYPSGHGSELADFLNSFDAIVNGIPVGDNRNLANGMGCLAAQLVANFKTDVGGIYLYPTRLEQECGQEYEYHVYEDKVKLIGPGGGPEFVGSWQEFAEYCNSEEIA